MKSLGRLYILILLVVLIVKPEGLFGQSKIWVGSWGCAPYAAGDNTPPSPYLENNTLRQVIRVSIGGDTLRVKLSNKTCSTPVTMNTVNVAVSTGGSTIDASTITNLKFDGSNSITIDPYSEVTSDPVDFVLDPSMQLAITIYYGQAATSADMTFHYGSRTDSYILEGDQSTSATFSGATIVERWYHINNIDVLASDTAGCVGVLGNSITDGYGLHGGLQNRWTDVFSQKLLEDERTGNIGVLNMGIGGTLVSGTSATTGLSRYKDDLLAQSGIRWIIMYYGTNDIAAGRSASTITNAYQTIVDDAHAMGIKVYGATITPFKGSGHYSESNEQVRKAVNEWIRIPGNFDACIDFDEVIRDPYDTVKMAAEYSKDWLHPNADGLALLGNSVNVNLFTDIESSETLFASAGSDQTLVDLGNTGAVSVNLNGSRSVSWGADIESYVWSKGEKQLATGELATINLPVGTHTITLTVTDGDGKTDSDNVVVVITKDTGVWLEAECGEVGALWNTETDDEASNKKYITVKTGNNSTDNAPASETGLVTYSFDVEEAGYYYFYARVICPSAVDDSFWIKMNGGSFSMWNNISATSWQWVKFSSGFSLSQGTNTLTIGFREDGAKLDKLWITTTEGEVSNDGSGANNCNTTGIQFQVPNEDIIIYPNPVKQTLNVKLPGTPASVSLINSLGAELFRQSSSSTSMLIDMAEYKRGIYFVVVTNEQKYVVRKVMKG